MQAQGPFLDKRGMLWNIERAKAPPKPSACTVLTLASASLSLALLLAAFGGAALGGATSFTFFPTAGALLSASFFAAASCATATVRNLPVYNRLVSQQHAKPTKRGMWREHGGKVCLSTAKKVRLPGIAV